MAFAVTGIYIVALFAAGMWFIRKHRADASKVEQSGDHSQTHADRRSGEDRRHHAALTGTH